MLKVKVFDGPVTLAQRAIVALWIVNIGAVLFLWANTSFQYFLSGPAGGFIAAGRLFGLLATYFALTQFMLMGRVGWIEKNFGLEKLASYHRLNGYLAITLILIHPVLVVTGYSIASSTNFFQEYLLIIEHFKYVWLAVIAQILFVGVVASSIYIARRKLKFETWYGVHLFVYVAIVSVFFHQFAVGGSFLTHPLARDYWYLVYAFVAINVIVWRFSLPSLKFMRHGFKVDRVVQETASTTSIYISGKNMKQWRSKPGQFVLVRIFAPGLWWQEHPFSLSQIPGDNGFRLTVRNVGDYTNDLRTLKSGAKVLVSGPLGRFTSDVARTKRRLFIAGGVGITPIRSLAEEACLTRQDSVLLYANRSPDDVALGDEIKELATQGLKTNYVYSAAPSSYTGEKGRINLALVKRLVPDYAERDIYLCGPPPMMSSLVDELHADDFNAQQLHFERFALHS